MFKSFLRQKERLPSEKEQEREILMKKLMAGWQLLNRYGKEEVLDYVYDSIYHGKVILRKTREKKFYKMVLQSFLHGPWKPERLYEYDREWARRLRVIKIESLTELLQKVTETASQIRFQN